VSTDNQEAAVKFYRDIMGLKVVRNESGSAEFEADGRQLYVDNAGHHGGVALGMVLEFVVDDLEKARDELMAAGCEIIRWEGKGKDCYVRDPYGGLFNLWER
jgi:catechol 2,3-dioxygenase-like lactoylglutathione lyase family enzyme